MSIAEIKKANQITFTYVAFLAAFFFPFFSGGGKIREIKKQRGSESEKREILHGMKTHTRRNSA